MQFNVIMLHVQLAVQLPHNNPLNDLAIRNRRVAHHAVPGQRLKHRDLGRTIGVWVGIGEDVRLLQLAHVADHLEDGGHNLLHRAWCEELCGGLVMVCLGGPLSSVVQPIGTDYNMVHTDDLILRESLSVC
jgi:hypothetical protein